jgi:hypothetical protein
MNDNKIKTCRIKLFFSLYYVILNLPSISGRLKCTKGIGRCDRGMDLAQYSRPILLQHFPMYRESDVDCNEPDQAPEDEKTQKFRERWECLSKESSEQVSINFMSETINFSLNYI